MVGALTEAWAVFAVAVGIPAAILLMAVVWVRPVSTLVRAAASVVLLAGIVAAAATVFVGEGEDALGITATPGPGGTIPAPTGPPPGPACTPSGTELQVVAESIRFDQSCLAVPADTPFTIEFDNRDSGVPHNVAVYGDRTASKVLFRGEVVQGPATETYSVQELPEGQYFFRCDVHPTQMTGTFVVGEE